MESEKNGTLQPMPNFVWQIHIHGKEEEKENSYTQN